MPRADGRTGEAPIAQGSEGQGIRSGIDVYGHARTGKGPNGLGPGGAPKFPRMRLKKERLGNRSRRLLKITEVRLAPCAASAIRYGTRDQVSRGVATPQGGND